MKNIYKKTQSITNLVCARSQIGPSHLQSKAAIALAQTKFGPKNRTRPTGYIEFYAVRTDVLSRDHGP